MHSWALLVSFLLLSCVHLEQERNFILFPLSCQASINSLHGSILLTFLKLGTCKSACWSSTAAGGAIQEQTCKLKQQAEATWHCPYHSVALPLVLLRISAFPYSFSTLLLNFSGKYSGMYDPGREDDLAEMISWKICMFHTPEISCLAWGIIHGQGWLIRAAQAKHKLAGGPMHQVWDHSQNRHTGLFQELFQGSWKPVENGIEMLQSSSTRYAWVNMVAEEDGWQEEGDSVDVAAARIQWHTGSCWEPRISNYGLAGISSHLLFHLQFFLSSVLFPALSSFYVTCQGYIINIFLPVGVRNGLSELRSRFILQLASVCHNKVR